jgi:hypothetical protein
MQFFFPILYQRTGSVDDKVERKLGEIEEAVKHTVAALAAAEDMDHKQLAYIQNQMDNFLFEVS